MKVALCLSGESRNWDSCYSSVYEQIIKKYNCDIFIHTWGIKGKQIPHHYIENYTHFFEFPDYKFIEKYNPKKIKIDYPNYDLFKLKIPNSRFYNTLMMWYSIYQSNDLRKEFERENNIKYDCIIRCRFDLFFEHFEIQELNSNTIYLPPNENVNNPFTYEMKKMLEKMGPEYMPNDQLSYGDSNSIDYYCSVYKILENDIKKYIHHPEGLLTEHLWIKNNTNILIETNNNIKIKINR